MSWSAPLSDSFPAVISATRGGAISTKIAASAQHLLFVSPFLFIPVYASMPSSCVSSYCAYVEISSLLSFLLCPGSDSDRSIDGSQRSGTWFGGDISLAPIWTPPESTGFLHLHLHLCIYYLYTLLIFIYNLKKMFFFTVFTKMVRCKALYYLTFI